MEKMQFTAIVLMFLLTLKLLLLPGRVVEAAVVRKAHWLMIGGTALLGVQFLLQYIFGLRAMGVTQAVMLNLALFIPCSWMLSLSVLYLQRRGGVSRTDRLAGGIAWAVALILLGVAVTIDGQPLLANTRELRRAEVAASVGYLAMQGYYAWKHTSNLRSMRRALQNYYDRDTGDLLLWMRFSILVLMVLALMVPLLIFVEGRGLAVFGILFFGGIFYLVDSFCGYVVSSAHDKVQEAEENEERLSSPAPPQRDEAQATSEHGGSPTLWEKSEEDNWQHVTQAVAKWTARGGHLRAGIKLPLAAEKIGVPQYQLSTWLRQQGFKYSEWMTDLRIKEAKRMMQEHPEWSNETIAQHCGFSDRSYFQKKFKEMTGQTPSDYQSSRSSSSSSRTSGA